MSKEKRRFNRYSVNYDFTIVIDGVSYKAETLDYSVDGLSVRINGSPVVKVGDVVELNIPKLKFKTPGKVMRISQVDGVMDLGLMRVGLLYGAIGDFAVADILLGLQRSGKSGLLYFKVGNMQKSIHFVKGDIVFGTSTLRDDWLGELLVREKSITPAQFEESSTIMKSSGKRHGTVLVEMGLLKPKELFEAVTRTVENIILSLFKLHKGDFLFKEGPLPDDESIKLRLSAANLIYRGLRALDDIELVRSMSPGADRVICFSTDPLDLFQDLKLDAMDKKLFMSVDGCSTYKELIASSGMDQFEAMRALNALLSTRVVELRENIFAKSPQIKNANWVDEVGSTSRTEEAEEKEQVKAADVFSENPQRTQAEFIKEIQQMHKEHKSLGYYGVLEIDQQATSSQIKRGYYRKARDYHPDKHYSLPEEMKDKLNIIFTYITQAYSTLSNPAQRKEYDDAGGVDRSEEHVVDPVQRANVKFEEAMVLMKRGRNEQAATVFGEAAYLDASNPKYHYFGSRALSQASKFKEAERTLQRAIRIEPFNPDYLAEAGHIYLALGFVKRAKSSFEKAVQLKPLHQRAMEGIKQLPHGA